MRESSILFGLEECTYIPVGSPAGLRAQRMRHIAEEIHQIPVECFGRWSQTILVELHILTRLAIVIVNTRTERPVGVLITARARAQPVQIVVHPGVGGCRHLGAVRFQERRPPTLTKTGSFAQHYSLPLQLTFPDNWPPDTAASAPNRLGTWCRHTLNPAPSSDSSPVRGRSPSKPVRPSTAAPA